MPQSIVETHWKRFLLPCLEVLQSNETVTVRKAQIVSKLIARLHIPFNEQVERYESGSRIIDNHVNSALQLLKKHGLVESGTYRGQWMLTQSGAEILLDPAESCNKLQMALGVDWDNIDSQNSDNAQNRDKTGSKVYPRTVLDVTYSSKNLLFYDNGDDVDAKCVLVKAVGRRKPCAIVLAGSRIVPSAKLSASCPVHTVFERKKFTDMLKGDVLQKNLIFSSVSGAISFVTGYSKSGNDGWYDSNGVKLKDLSPDDLAEETTIRE